jgi:MFS family permease
VSTNSPYPQDQPADQPREEDVPVVPQYSQGPYQQPQYPQPQYPPSQYSQPQYSQPQYSQSYPPASDPSIGFSSAGPTVEHPQATLAFVLGLLSVLGLLVLGPFGWYYGRRVVREIDQDPRTFSNRGLAMAGMVLGIIGTVFLLFAAVMVVLAIVFVILAGASVSG